MELIKWKNWIKKSSEFLIIKKLKVSLALVAHGASTTNILRGHALWILGTDGTGIKPAIFEPLRA
jgi:hypothetical protein